SLRVLAPAPPADFFWIALEASRIAIKHMLPVIILSDGYLANGAEPWKIPHASDLPEFPVKFETNPVDFQPYRRDPDTLARPWAIPGTAGLEHRIGGLEKADITGTIDYDPDNHDRMVRLRQAKIDGIAADIEPLAVEDPDGSARVLVLGWGSTYGSIGAAVRRVRNSGHAVAQAHLPHLNPFPSNLGEVPRRSDQV